MREEYKTIGRVVDSHQKASQLATERNLSWAPPVAKKGADKQAAQSSKSEVKVNSKK